MERIFDTHNHLNFQAFDGMLDKVIGSSKKSGIKRMVVVGTNVISSKKAVEIAEKFDGVYASVGIHPHHVYQYQKSKIKNQKDLEQIEKLLSQNKVVAIGEVGMDKHIYKSTKYQDYQITNEFLDLQKSAFEAQIKLALTYQKSLIIHNREAVKEILEVLETNWNKTLEYRTVFHCCEPDERLLNFAKANHIYIGIDGDITHDKAKQDFVREIPLDLLVLETDSPFLTPLGFKYPNTPANLSYILEFIAKIRKMEASQLAQIIYQNSINLFAIKNL